MSYRQIRYIFRFAPSPLYMYMVIGIYTYNLYIHLPNILKNKKFIIINIKKKIF